MTEMRPELHKWCFKSCVENLGCGTTYEFCTGLYLTQMNNHFLLRRGDDVDNKRKYCKNQSNTNKGKSNSSKELMYKRTCIILTMLFLKKSHF